MTFGLVAVAGASLLGGAIASSGARSAAETQAGAARDAAALQKETRDEQIRLQEPYRQAGLVGQARLMELLGLRMPAQAGGGAPYMRSDAELRNALAGQFTSEGSPGGYVGGGGREGGDGVYAGATPGVIDEAGLSRAMAAARQGDQNAMNNYQPPQGGQSADFGKYARDFSLADLEKDTGYQAELAMIGKQNQLIERDRARRGLLQSPGTSNALFENAQLRARLGYGSALDRYYKQRESQLNPLGSLATLGQSAASNQGTAAGQYGTNAGNLMMQGGQAMAAGQLGVGNTFNNALGTMASSYQNQTNFTDYLNRMGNRSPIGQPSYMAPQQSNIDPYSGVRQSYEV